MTGNDIQIKHLGKRMDDEPTNFESLLVGVVIGAVGVLFWIGIVELGQWLIQ